MDDKPKRPRLLVSAFDLERQLRRLSQSTLGADRGRWPYQGLTCAFPILDEKLDGLHNSIYVLGSAARMGKTTFALQLAFDILVKNPEAHVLFISLDQPARDLNIRLVAMAGECHTEYVQYPDPKKADRYDDKRQRGLARLVKLKNRLTIVDESLGSLRFIDLVSFIRQIKGRKTHPLVVFIDPYYKIRIEGGTQDMRTLSERLMSEFKTLATSQEIGLVVTTKLARGAGLTRPSLEDLEDQPGVLYDSHVLALLYCDFFLHGNTPFLEWEWGTDDLMVPVFELDVVKNKMGSSPGRLYYRFYTTYSKFKECSALEMDNYSKMLQNLQEHDKQDPAVPEEAMSRVETIDDRSL